MRKQLDSQVFRQKHSQAMRNADLLHIHKHANDFFVGTADHKQWHRSQCVPLPKSGDLSNRNKWRGIVLLMDVLSHEQNQNRHQIPIWRHARTRLPRWLIRTQNNAQPTKKSQSAVPHGIVADLVNAYNKYTANHMTFSSTSLSDTAPLLASSRPCKACIATSSLFSRLKKRYSNSTKPL